MLDSLFHAWISWICRQPALYLQVKNMSIVDALLHQPFHTVTHPTYGTVMRMMDVEEKFDIGVALTV